ncbi:MAG: hypothetical protein WBN09_11260 [Woeseiaceae bacterium]
MTRPLLLAYYAATFLFLLLDYLAGWNLRIAFLDPYPVWRGAYYGVCFLCLGIIIWRPALTVIVAAFESLVTLSALIIGFAMRAILVTDSMLEGSADLIDAQEIFNFLISGSIAYIAWMRGVKELGGGSGQK